MHRMTYNNIENLNVELICNAANEGDKIAYKILKDAGTILGNAISNVLNVLGINVVIIGGGLSITGPIFFNSIYDSIKLRTLSWIGKDLKLLKTSLDKYGAALGAALFEIDDYFENFLTKEEI